jgi:DNA-binding SARP family transcriptional activator
VSFGRVAPDPDLAAPPEHDILVRLLSDIAVEGGKPLRPKATSVVAYLALHRSVSTERLEEACWFGADGVSHRKRLRDTMTECRDAIGSQHLPPNRGGTYTAGPGLGTDLDLFEWHVDQASRTPPDLGLEHYEAALALVRGKPFSYANAARASFGWVDFEHHATTWDHRIAGVAQAAAGLLIDARRYDDATVLLHRVVRAIPLNSSVVEALIGACLERGDLRGARAVYSEHATALRQAGLGEPGASLETLLV